MHDPRTRVPPPELTAMVRDAVAQHGVAGAQRELGLTRGVIVQVMAGLGVMPGTLALLREAAARRAGGVMPPFGFGGGGFGGGGTIA